MTEPANAKVLIVEDMEEMRNIIRSLLTAMGFGTVAVARNGEEAWKILQTSPPDVVLCDWNMPRMSGRELLDAVRADPKLSLIPFVMITGENSATQVKSAVAGGVTDFIIKPFTAATLEQRLLNVLRMSLSVATSGERPATP